MIHSEIEYQDIKDVNPEENFKCPRCDSNLFGTSTTENGEDMGSCHGGELRIGFNSKGGRYVNVPCEFTWNRHNDDLYWVMTYTLKAMDRSQSK